MPPATPIRDALRRAVVRSGLTHAEIADLSGAPLLTVRRIAFGTANPLLSTADKLAPVLGLTLSAEDPTDNPA